MITTVPPKIRWKWAVTHEVLWIMAFIARLILITPPKPPNQSMKKARPVARTMGRSQGRAPIQPKRPLPPRRRPAISNEAGTVKMVIKVGTVTNTVSAICRNLKPLECSGSMNR